MANLNEVYLFRLEAAPPAYLWSGQGDLPVAADALVGATTYTGAGDLIDLPSVSQLINGTADRVDFVLSGATAEAVRLAHEDRDTVKGAMVRIGSLVLDENLQPVGAVDWEWQGTADVISITRDPDKDGKPKRSIGLSVGSADTARSRPEFDFWTDASQHERYPTDAFFSHVGGISQGTTRTFGAK